jgi:5-methylcytosine-specific restriction endonuclease McrA
MGKDGWIWKSLSLTAPLNIAEGKQVGRDVCRPELSGRQFRYCQKCRRVVTVTVGPETRLNGTAQYVCMSCRRDVLRDRARYLGVKVDVRAATGEGVCLCCGRTDDLTVDHVVPRCRRGSNRKENVQILCRVCNSIKGDKYVDFRRGSGYGCYPALYVGLEKLVSGGNHDPS